MACEKLLVYEFVFESTANGQWRKILRSFQCFPVEAYWVVQFFIYLKSEKESTSGRMSAKETKWVTLQGKESVCVDT